VSAKHAVLGFFLQKPRQPSDVVRRLVQALGDNWKLNSGQLSQIIQYLEQNGMIKLLEDDPHAAGETRVFAGTAAGTDEFERWFAAPIGWVRPQRRPLLVKLLVAVVLGEPERLDVPLAECEDYAEQCAARVRELSQKQERIPLGGLRVRAEHELLWFSLGGEIQTEEAELKWARYIKEKIVRLKDKDVTWPTTPQRPPTDAMQERQNARGELFDGMAKQRGATAGREPNRDGDG